MCHCLARAILKHLEFNQNDEFFLQDFSSQTELAFTYNFTEKLKLTLNPKQADPDFSDIKCELVNNGKIMKQEPEPEQMHDSSESSS